MAWKKLRMKMKRGHPDNIVSPAKGKYPLKLYVHACMGLGPLDRRGGSFKCRSLDRSQKVATWLIDSQGAQAWNKGS